MQCSLVAHPKEREQASILELWEALLHKWRCQQPFEVNMLPQGILVRTQWQCKLLQIELFLFNIPPTHMQAAWTEQPEVFCWDHICHYSSQYGIEGLSTLSSVQHAPVVCPHYLFRPDFLVHRFLRWNSSLLKIRFFCPCGIVQFYP